MRSATSRGRAVPRERYPVLRIVREIRPYWGAFALALGFGLIKFAIPFVIAHVIGEVVDILNALASGTLQSQDAWAAIWKQSVLAGAAIWLATIPTYFRSILAMKAMHEAMRALRARLYAHIQSQSHAFFDSHRSGALVSRIIGDVEAIKPFLSKVLIQAWLSVAAIVGTVGYFLWNSWLLGLLSICLMPLQAWVQISLGARIRAREAATRGQLAKLSGNIQEKLAATTVVKAFTREEHELELFHQDADELVELGVATARLSSLSETTMHLLIQTGQLILFTAGGWLVTHGGDHVTPGLVVKFILMQGQLQNPIAWLNETQLLTASAIGSLEKIFELMDTRPEIEDRAAATPLQRAAGQVTLEDVSFTYPGAMTPVIEHLSLTIPARTTLALVGPSGGGKSTIIHLLNRFYEWHRGSIRMDGQDIRSLTLKSLRAHIGLVSQEPVLFSGTIEDNIRYGRLDASFEDVQDAARRACADEFISQLPSGYQTLLGERGARLSGGQRQRISIARAFLKNPSIIILDEATSALDAVSERKVQTAMEALMKDRTAIVIAHRFSTIRNAHAIAVIEGGKIRELGTWSSLLQQGGAFARLWKEQLNPGAGGHEAPTQAGGAVHPSEAELGLSIHGINTGLTSGPAKGERGTLCLS